MRPALPRALLGLLLCAGHAGADPGGVDPSDAAAIASMQASYLALQSRLDHNAFHRPLTLLSSEGAGLVTGDIHALLDTPFVSAQAALASPADWCGILVLHINTKRCLVSTSGRRTTLGLWIGMKTKQTLADASRLALSFRVAAKTPDYLCVALRAREGPMGTRDYRIMLEAIPLAGGRTFIHLAYAYGYDTFGALAMQAYLTTLGRDKVGFTLVVGEPGDDPGHERHIGGPRGLVERNTMRYYLAIEAYLDALAVPQPARFEKRIRDWYAAAEHYPRQLHEMERAEYLDMKREAHRAALPPA